ncbi:MAG TPA: hypothetical protein VKA94_06295, partial [Hyphomicrobiales bacterium]|nr:hypothetical protein [Hyphomicrobiales bacterium]
MFAMTKGLTFAILFSLVAISPVAAQKREGEPRATARVGVDASTPPGASRQAKSHLSAFFVPRQS